VIAAIRNGSNPPVRNLYDRLKERGKHQKVAEVACMRKLLAIVWGLLEQQRTIRSEL
jgi:transposase